MSLLLTQLGGGTAWTVNLSDTITLSDAAIKAVGKAQTDTLSLTDSIRKAVGKASADTFTLSDSSTKTVSHALADIITLSDSIATLSSFAIFPSDTIILTDSVSMVVPPLPPFPPVFLGGGGIEIGHPRMKPLKRKLWDDEIEELEIVEILTCWLGKN